MFIPKDYFKRVVIDRLPWWGVTALVSALANVWAHSGHANAMSWGAWVVFIVGVFVVANVAGFFSGLKEAQRREIARCHSLALDIEEGKRWDLAQQERIRQYYADKK
jgi:hypothetical protein